MAMTLHMFDEAAMNELLAAVGAEAAGDASLHSCSFEEMDLDSLARMEIAGRIQDRYGVEVEEELTAECTPAALVVLVNQRLAAAAQG
jgi:acyl carrier protein